MPKKRTQSSVGRNSAQLRGVRAQLGGELNANTDGAHVTIDIKTARNLVEICDQAIHTEVGHEPTEDELR